MKKNEILEKARAEKSDEMEKFVQDKSLWCVFIVMVVCLIAFSIIRASNDERTNDLAVTVCSGVAAGNFYRFVKLRQKSYLFSAILLTVGAVTNLISFILVR